MLKTTLKLIFRNWWRNKTFTIISLISLTVGIACTALLISFVAYEYGIEKNNPNLDQLVWVMWGNQEGRTSSFINNEIIIQLEQNYPEVEESLQINNLWINNVEIDNQKFEGPLVLNVNASFPEFFPFEMLYGSWKSLDDPTSIVLTEEVANRYFGNENALGKQIVVNEFSGDVLTMTVGGVVKSRAQSVIKFDGLYCNPETKEAGNTLLKVVPNTNLHLFEQKVNEDEIYQDDRQCILYPFSEAISLNHVGGSGFWYSRKDDLLLTGLISAILVFIIAIFNYVNMSFSRILQQVKTLHTEKLMGARAADVHLQVFMDTFLAVLISFILAMILMHDLLPLFNNAVDVHFSTSYFYSNDFFPILVTLALLLTIIPAWIMGRKISGLSGAEYRMFFVTKKNHWIASMVMLQFVVAFVLVIAAITANRQVEIARKSIDRYSNVIEVGQTFSKKSIVGFESRLKSIPGIENYAFSEGGIITTFNVAMDIKNKSGESQQNNIILMSGSDGLIETLKINQIAGDHWDRAREKYPAPVFVNKVFADITQDTPAEIIGTPLYNYVEGYDSLIFIAGVIENFNINSLEYSANPILIKYNDKSSYHDLVYIRTEEGKLNEVLVLLKEAWELEYPDDFFKYNVTYDFFKNRNSKIFEMWHLLQMYSLISILLICFGLFGISFYSVRQRTKEIGIRKINGATTPQIVWLLLKPMFTWIAVGFVIGVPLAWLFMERWLQQFVYRVDVSFSSCLIALAFVALVSVITVIGQALRVAKINPAKTLT